MTTLPLGFFNFLMDYSFLCEGLREDQPHCQITKVLSHVGELLARQDCRGAYAGKGDADAAYAAYAAYAAADAATLKQCAVIVREYVPQYQGVEE